jgi:citrate lyase subunit beta/citryl-CoA lyase
VELKKLLQANSAGSPTAQVVGADKTLIVRVNAHGTPHFAQDLDAVVWPALHVVNLPMVESADTVRQAAAALEVLERERGIARPLGILANIESPRGLRLAADIAMAHPRVIGLQIGYGDLFAPLGIASGEPSATQ